MAVVSPSQGWRPLKVHSQRGALRCVLALRRLPGRPCGRPGALGAIASRSRRAAHRIGGLAPSMRDKADEIFAAMRAEVTNQASAKWFIDHGRNYDALSAFNKIAKEVLDV